MAGSQFKVKLIGGKLVQVPNFDYLQEYKSGLKKSNQQSYEKYQNGRQGSMSLYSNLYTESREYQRLKHDNGTQMDRGFQNTGEHRLSKRHQDAIPSKLNASSLDFSQRQSNQLQAERNRRRAQEQLQSSALALDPIDNDDDESVSESEIENNALASQVADCLKSSNKQKLAYALRAMTRLDSSGSGYITVREFRDILLMYQIFIIGGTLEKLVEKYRNNNGKINYKQLWNFVINSFNSSYENPARSGSPEPVTDESRVLNAAMKHAQKFFRAYAQKHGRAFDFAEITNSFENCDRSRTQVMRIKEMRIICRYYLKVDNEALDKLLEHCDSLKNGWINYYKFIDVLKDAQPTYLPPIKHTRRNTFNLDDEDFPNLSIKDDNMTRKSRGREKREYTNEDYDPEFKGDNADGRGQRSIAKDVQGPRSEGKMLKQKELSGEGTRQETPRRKWYESEESWMKRKRRSGKPLTRRKVYERKKWENSAPVKSIKDSCEEALSDEKEDLAGSSKYSDEDMDSHNASKS